MRGLLVVFEGLDQSGKQTQAERLRERLVAAGRTVRLLSFPSYDTHIGAEIGRALKGERDYAADTMQLLYVANRFEWKPEIERELAAGTVVVCDRYLASSVAYGEAFGLDGAWLADIQRYLPQPDLTVLLDIEPQVSASRKTADRDKYERDLPPIEVGDLVAVLDTGAYGAVMGSNYNRRLLPPEVLVDNGAWTVIRRRQTLDDVLALES